jgi:hypothetical protein
MDALKKLTEEFMEFQTQLKNFLLNDSALKFIEGSKDIVEGGAYSWVQLSKDQIANQQVLITTYDKIMEPILKCINSEVEGENTTSLRHSYDRVKNVLKQEGIVFENDIKDVYTEISKELKLQLYLSTQLE